MRMNLLLQSMTSIHRLTITLGSVVFCYEHLGQHPKAIEFYRKASKADAYFHEAFYGIGKCLEAQDKSYESIHFFKRALKLDEANADYWLAKANAEYKTGNIISSLEAFEEACVLEPSNPEVWKNWSFVHYESGDMDKAVDLINAGIDEIPGNPDLYYRAVAYLITAGKYKEAFNYLENALTLNFDGHTVLFEFFPKLETQKALFRIIDQYRNK